MKKVISLLFSILLFASVGFSQILGVTSQGGAPPTTNCNTLNVFYLNTSNNTLWACIAGSYTQLTNSSGGGTLSVANGGTGLTSGTSGGVLAFTGSTTLASSAALTLNGVLLGGGAGAVPTATTAGSANQVFVVPGGGGAPSFGQIDLSQSAAIKNVLLSANGGFPVFNPAGTQQTATTLHAVFGTCTLGTNCAVTLTGSAAFTSATSYGCGATDFTGANAIKAVQAAGSVTFTGTGTDVIQFNCIGT